eukprot:7525137-Alexandrium_andersonii.AAC.1
MWGGGEAASRSAQRTAPNRTQWVEALFCFRRHPAGALCRESAPSLLPREFPIRALKLRTCPRGGRSRLSG